MDRIVEAIELCLETEAESPEQLDFVGVQTLAVGE